MSKLNKVLDMMKLGGMATLFGGLAGAGALGVVCLIALIFLPLIATLYGLWLAFSASILLGIVVLLVEPSPLVIGLVMIFFHKNLAQMVIDFLNK